ncbi:methyl-accepting chemotaxis protein [Massilia sp. TSP1-1-2]|uniref:methyl-accepting chemotaxis protein n=1 Tax=Massilia sp. TSP1-1-2 TaxID=2804649 RepID=UPI003CFA8568
MFASLLARLRIGPKLLLAPGLVLALLIVSSSAAYWAMLRQNQSLETIVAVRAARIKEASDLVAEAQGAHARSYQLLTWISASVSAARIDALETDIHRRHAALAQRFARLAAARAPGSAERDLLEQAEAAHARYVGAVLEVIDLAGGDQSVAANAMVKAEQAFEREAWRLAALAGHEQALSEAASRGAASDFQLLRLLMPALVAASILLSLLTTFLVRRALLREVHDIGQSALDLASGNLTVRARNYGGDEISDTSRTLDASIRTLNHTLKDILDSARSIDSASRSIAMGNARWSDRAGEAASSFEQTSATMEQLSATVNQNAGHALAANRLAASASDLAQRGGDVVRRLVHTLGTIKGKSRRVVDIADLIDHLAGQTATLALNAALEAARAGEHGVAFAAVASQVRLLAQRSAAAARQVRELVEQSVAQIDGGSAAAAEAGYSMADIADSVRQVGDMISQISEASAEQASGMSDVTCAIVQMDQMTQQNSALVQEAAGAAASLQAQAYNLSQAVAGFKLDEGGEVGRPKLWLASKRE